MRIRLSGIYSHLFFFILALLSACDLKDNEAVPGERFVRIYETGEFEREYLPLDIQATADGGYLLLAGVSTEESDFLTTYLLKVDQEGKRQWEHYATDYVNPVSELMAEEADAFSVIVMDKLQLGTHVLHVQLSPGAEPVFSSSAYFKELSYPLAGAAIPGGYAILHWNRNNKSAMMLSKTNGNALHWTKSYDIYEDVEARVMGHLTRQQQPTVPFRVGALDGQHLYFNGYNNFTLALTFVKAENGEQTGILNGTRYASGLSQLQPLPYNRLALSRFRENGENVYVPATALNPNQIATAKDLSGNEMPELTPYAAVKIRQFSYNSRAYTLFLSSSKNGEMVLYAYDEAGVLQGTEYLGAGNKFEAGSLTATPDGGLAILGRAYVAGRFPRLCLFKLSQAEMSELLR